MTKKIPLLSALTALFAAVICASGFFRIPLGPVPIVLQNIVCLLTGLLLGGFTGSLPVLLFIAAGIIGLPVFSGGTGGISVILGPTGGFIPGYFLGALTAALIAGKPSVEEKNKKLSSAIRLSVAVLAGMIVLYIPGVIRFSFWALGNNKVPVDKSVFAYTMGACVIPYIPGDILKMIAAVPVALKIRPVMAQYIK